MQHAGESFKKKYGLDPTKNVKTRLRMLETIEKQRKILSANIETSVVIEALMEDEDLNFNIQRSEFEEMIKPFIERFK
jgi:heat shock protein 4